MVVVPMPLLSYHHDLLLVSPGARRLCTTGCVSWRSWQSNASRPCSRLCSQDQCWPTSSGPWRICYQHQQQQTFRCTIITSINTTMPSVLWHCKNWVMRRWHSYLSGARCRLFAHGPADATAIWRAHHLLPHVNPGWFYLPGTGLPRLSWKRGH